MKLRFGFHLDGQHGRQASNTIGVADVGPLGLLSILETQLGLTAAAISASERCVQYRDCLLKLDGPQRFFHRSLAADDFGTAAELLHWRDTWRLHGWTGCAPADDALARLKDMADVEILAATMVSAGLAERLIAIATALAVRKHRIASLALVEPQAQFPLRWQQVLAHLPCTPPAPRKVHAGGLLGELQQALLAEPARKELAWNADGSLIVARSESLTSGARWIAETLRQHGTDTLLVATSEAAATDMQLAAADYPGQGLSDTSAFRPALQLLPLTLELLWAPINFHALIQFLTHPIAPIPAKARRKLAGIQAEYPGVGGPRWKHVVAELAEDYGAHAPTVLDAIAFWIEHDRYDPADGAPVATVLERAQRLAEFFHKSPGEASPALRTAYASGLSQCQSFAENLGRLIAQGATTLRPRQLEQLASQSTARGNDNPLRLAEVGALPCVTSPSAALDTHDAVIWGPLDAPALPAPWPWSKAEIATLLVAGCALPAYTALLQQAADAWLKPILVARKRLVLLLPPPDRESHPVWQLIEAMIPDIPVLSVEALLTDAMAKREVVSCTPLPAIKRWWHLPLGTHVPAVEAYSYSQLEKQLFNPYHWLLAHAARLRSGSLLSLADDFRLKGILAHSLVERLFAAAAGKDMADAAFAAWFDPAFDRLIAEEGALYLMPGRRTDLENLRLTLRRALIELRMLLRRAGVALVEAERNLSGQFVGGKLGGKSDLVLAKPDGESAIIDMKWGGKSHRPRLEDNRHLQLAIYAELLRQNTQRWPYVAYFLLSEATLLTRDGAWFPGVTPVLDKTGENTAQLWLRFLETWKWRQAQFAEGTFEVVLEPGDTPESQAPETGLAAEVLNPAYNECLPLAGWGELA